MATLVSLSTKMALEYTDQEGKKTRYTFPHIKADATEAQLMQMSSGISDLQSVTPTDVYKIEEAEIF